MKKTIALLVVASAALLLSAGCNKQTLPDGMPELFPLTVNVKQGGEPAPDMLLTFNADGLAWGVGAKSDAQGKAVIMTQGQYNGAPAGEYTVTVTNYFVTPSKFGRMPADPRERDEWQKNVDEENAPVFLKVAPEYLERDTTPLKITVAKGTPTVDVDLGEKVEIEVDRKTRQILNK